MAYNIIVMQTVFNGASGNLKVNMFCSAILSYAILIRALFVSTRLKRRPASDELVQAPFKTLGIILYSSSAVWRL